MGQWLISMSVFTALECPDPSPIIGATYTVSNMTLNSTVNYTCDQGNFGNGSISLVQICAIDPGDATQALWLPIIAEQCQLETTGELVLDTVNCTHMFCFILFLYQF